MKHLRRTEVGRGRTRVFAESFRVGSDLVVFVGGEGPHVGAATLAERAAEGETSVATVTGHRHREGELTDRVARDLTEATGRRTLAFCGIHLDRITPGEIAEIRANVDALIRILVSGPEGAGRPGNS